ncbi:penicillin-binding protein 2 [Lacrimispora sp. NSJ-141]|uniref:Penicillin-binding protein 2 n=1 Tax=Lientehia hominis TaxID=2897778 RepID=A0AAP2RHA8_9FIRM|nr:penicillin-binding protein 2 [Lientehia hominis]MCD2491283.1 penicillin-binding protein 2 [Lientehia hominis]
MKQKLALTFILVALVLFGLAIAVGIIGKQKGGDYGRTVLAQQTYTADTIPFKRGEITDRNGTVLAANEAVYNLILDPSVITADENITGPTLDALVECYGYDRTELEKLINENPNKRYIRYEKRMSEEKRDKFLAKETEINENLKIKDKIDGVWFETEYKRIYPYSSLACDLIGFASEDGSLGSYGMEQYYNDTLAGVPGRRYGSINEDSDAEQVTRDAVDGNTVVSTIDVNLQSIVENQIKLFNEKIGSKNTAVIVMNPNNGEVLAMASYPYFDLNNPSDMSVSGYYTQEQIDAMSEDERTDAQNEIWKNFITQTTYEPGSTAKPLTIAAGLEEGSLKTTDTYMCDGGEDIAGGGRINCHKLSGHGQLDVKGAIVESCNDALMHIGWQIGKDTFCKYQPIFGLGDRTGIDLPGEEYGILKNKEDMSDIDLATNSFGQNFNVTVIQMAAAYCSVINGGSYYTPHVVREVLSPEGSVVESKEKTLVRETVSESTSDFLKTAMLAMVDEQTTYSTVVPGYEIGGKTGTAEKQPRSEEKYAVSFCSFVPASNPEYFMMVVIDEPNVENQSAGGHATTLTHDLWVDILPYLNLFPTRSTGEEETTTESPLQEPNGTDAQGANPEGENPEGEDPGNGENPEGEVPQGEPRGDENGYEEGMFQDGAE